MYNDIECGLCELFSHDSGTGKQDNWYVYLFKVSLGYARNLLRCLKKFDSKKSNYLFSTMPLSKATVQVLTHNSSRYITKQISG